MTVLPEATEPVRTLILTRGLALPNYTVAWHVLRVRNAQEHEVL